MIETESGRRRAFGEYCAHAVARHARWGELLSDVEAEAQRLGLMVTPFVHDFLQQNFKNQRRAAALRRAKRATVKLNRRIGRRK